MGPAAGERIRLASVEDHLARLQAQYEVALSAFKFDEANALQRHIGALEAERQMLVRALPPAKATPQLPVDVIRPIERPVRRRRARRPR
jgi:hypothetical protein